jgi:hypothetical protein
MKTMPQTVFDFVQLIAAAAAAADNTVLTPVTGALAMPTYHRPIVLAICSAAMQVCSLHLVHFLKRCAVVSHTTAHP